jgi:hypothetical protein
MKLIHDLARLGADERRNIVSEFVDDVFAGLDVDPVIAARMRTVTPELPDEPTTEQIEAWIELAELVRDEDFRRRIRAMAQRSAQERAAAPAAGAAAGRESQARISAAVGELAGAALADGIDPVSPRRHGRSSTSSPGCSRSSTGARTRPSSARGWPTRSPPSPTAAWSATGSCWES